MSYALQTYMPSIGFRTAVLKKSFIHVYIYMCVCVCVCISDLFTWILLYFRITRKCLLVIYNGLWVMNKWLEFVIKTPPFLKGYYQRPLDIYLEGIVTILLQCLQLVVMNYINPMLLVQSTCCLAFFPRLHAI